MPSNAPLLSVIIPSYKMGPYIGDALASIGHQSYPHWEVLVVDDCGPEDGTRAAVESFATAHPGKRVVYIRHEQNGGVSKARNTAIAAATGDYCGFLDPDDLWQPSFAARMMSAFADEANVQVVCSPMQAFRMENGVKVPERDLYFETWQTRRFPQSLALANFIQPSGVVCATSVLRALGGFDEDPKIQHVEDYDLWIRLAQAGNVFCFVNEIHSGYRKHIGAATSNAGKMARRQEALANKHSGFFIAGQAVMLNAIMHRMTARDAAIKNPLRWLAGKYFKTGRRLGKS